ncbi:MAG: hypothetical protein R6U21_06215 [Thermoplasmatota archaeon]
MVTLISAKLFVFFLFISSFLGFFSAPCNGNPIVEEVYCYPFEPLPLSTVTFNAGINNNNTMIKEVRLIAQECNDTFCFDNENISMNHTYTCCMAFYEATISLTHKNATQVNYHLEIKSNTTWYKDEPMSFSLSSESLSIKTDEEKTTSTENLAPGFEGFFIFSIVLCAILFSKINQNHVK